MPTSSLLYIGVKGHVVALDNATGEEAWRSKLTGDFVNVVLQDNSLYASANGQLYRLDPATGHIKWTAPLKGLGYGLITIAGGQQTVAGQRKREDDESAAAGAATVMS